MYVQAGSLVLLTFLTQLVHSLSFVKHAPAVASAASGGTPGGAAKVASVALALTAAAGASSAAGASTVRAAVPYAARAATRVLPAANHPASISAVGKMGNILPAVFRK